MEVNHDDLRKRSADLAQRFLTIHEQFHTEKAHKLSLFLKTWSEKTRAITTFENIQTNILPAAIEWFEMKYPQYAVEARRILTSILTDGDVDWPTLTDELYRLVVNHSLKPQCATNFVSATIPLDLRFAFCEHGLCWYSVESKSMKPLRSTAIGRHRLTHGFALQLRPPGRTFQTFSGRFRTLAGLISVWCSTSPTIRRG